MSDHHGHNHGGDAPSGFERFMFILGVGLTLAIIAAYLFSKYSHYFPAK